jgi:hypothetical protein
MDSWFFLQNFCSLTGLGNRFSKYTLVFLGGRKKWRWLLCNKHCNFYARLSVTHKTIFYNVTNVGEFSIWEGTLEIFCIKYTSTVFCLNICRYNFWSAILLRTKRIVIHISCFCLASLIKLMHRAVLKIALKIPQNG